MDKKCSTAILFKTNTIGSFWADSDRRCKPWLKYFSGSSPTLLKGIPFIPVTYLVCPAFEMKKAKPGSVLLIRVFAFLRAAYNQIIILNEFYRSIQYNPPTIVNFAEHDQRSASARRATGNSG